VTHPAHIAMLRGILENVSAGKTDMAARESFVEASRYTSQAFFEKEQATIFRRHPIAIAHEGQIPEPGSCLAHDALGVPLLLVRNREGGVGGFLNVCRHRSTRLLSEEGPCTRKSLVCRYHNWTYDLDGRLKNVPLPEAFPNLDKSDHGLVRVPLEVRHGLIWVLPDAKGSIDLAAHLGRIGEELDALDMSRQVFFCQAATRTQCNWKLIVDGFLESYHIKRLHSHTIAPFFMDGLGATEQVGRHLCSLVARREIAEALEQPESAWDMRHHVSISHYIFPNTVMIYHPDYTSHLGLYPQSPDETLFVHTMMVPHAPRSEKENKHWQRSFELIEGGVFQSEDLSSGEQIQAGLRSGANKVLTLGGFEQSIRLFHDVLDEAMA